MNDEAASPQRKIRVLIADDHALVRSGVESVLSCHDDIEVVAQAEDGVAAVSLCKETKPDVVLMDLVMPRMDGPTAIEEILRWCPDSKIIALTSFTEEDLIEGALRAGAIGYLIKTISGAQLAAAIREADLGRPTLAPEASRVLMHAVKAGGARNDLTSRERQVLRLMSDGLTNNEIAERLEASLSTVKAQVSSVISKLGASSRTEAVGMALRQQLI